MIKIIFFALCFFFPSSAQAYIGPGLGGGVITVVIGVIVSFFLGLVAIVWYPIKRLFFRNKKKKPGNNNA